MRQIRAQDQTGQIKVYLLMARLLVQGCHSRVARAQGGPRGLVGLGFREYSSLGLSFVCLSVLVWVGLCLCLCYWVCALHLLLITLVTLVYSVSTE